MNFVPSNQRMIASLGHIAVAGAIATSLLLTQAAADDTREQPARIEQQATANMADLNIELPGGTLRNLLGDLRKNNAATIQKGSNNVSRISQFRMGNYPLGNIAWVYQNGHGNVADIRQVGGSNIGVVLQHGNNFEAAISQTGSELGAVINQYGFNADASINQFGSGSQGVSIEQLSRSGAGMTVTVETR